MHLVPGDAVRAILTAHARAIEALVARTYSAHDRGETVNPDSYFLRFPDQPANRIIALPAAIDAPEMSLSGIKWIASYPGNTAAGLARASAVVILNSPETGYPYAILEGAAISAARTAASAVLGAGVCSGLDRRAESVAVVGCGIIARTILDQFRTTGWQIGTLLAHDLDPRSAAALVAHVGATPGPEPRTAATLEEALAAQIVIFTTSAGAPYLDPDWRFGPGQTVLNISLRDIAPQQILAAQNVFDDVDHCLKAGTAPHLAEQSAGNRDFVTGTIAAVLEGRVTLSPETPVIYSPFGMGILDLALGDFVYRRARANGTALEIGNFFGDVSRW
ncbi:MAG: 2,3-diaminopropionate biosynthesis protein SbnB [Rhodobacteraceae bacterium]|nr:MAG: 2,3-diaminopropionate biosynthesis protein SbnB [Paracoccaceae bacterium]